MVNSQGTLSCWQHVCVCVLLYCSPSACLLLSEILVLCLTSFVPSSSVLSFVPIGLMFSVCVSFSCCLNAVMFLLRSKPLPVFIVKTFCTL